MPACAAVEVGGVELDILRGSRWGGDGPPSSESGSEGDEVSSSRVLSEGGGGEASRPFDLSVGYRDGSTSRPPPARAFDRVV